MASRTDTSLCFICLDVFQIPRVLPSCSHSFCEDCIITYLQTFFAGKHEFPCPLCTSNCQPTSTRAIPPTEEKVGRWVHKYLKINHKLVASVAKVGNHENAKPPTITIEIPPAPVTQRSFRERVATLDSTVTMTTPTGNIATPVIFESCVWMDDYIVVVERGRNQLVLVHEPTQSISHRYQCNSAPMAVTAFESTQFAVCMPDATRVDIYKIENEMIKLCHCEPTQSMVYDAHYCTRTDRLFMLLRKKGEVLVKCVKSRVDTYIPFQPTTRQTVLNSYHFGVDGHNGIVAIIDSRRSRDSVVAIDNSGQILYEYKHGDLKAPECCVFDFAGNAYIVSKLGNSVHQVSKTGEHIRQLLHGQVDKPSCLCFNNTMDKFAILHSSSDESLKIFTFK